MAGPNSGRSNLGKALRTECKEEGRDKKKACVYVLGRQIKGICWHGVAAMLFMGSCLRKQLHAMAYVKATFLLRALVKLLVRHYQHLDLG